MDLKKLWCMKIPVTISSFSRKVQGNITDLQHQFSLDWAITRHLNSTENTLLMSSMKPINGTRSTFYWTGKTNRLPFLSTANTLLMYHSIATSGTKPSHSLIASKRASSIRYPFTLWPPVLLQAFARCASATKSVILMKPLIQSWNISITKTKMSTWLIHFQF